jgi:hypothetical protein
MWFLKTLVFFEPAKTHLLGRSRQITVRMVDAEVRMMNVVKRMNQATKAMDWDEPCLNNSE